MRYRYDSKQVTINAIDRSKGKLAQWKAPVAGIKRLAHIWHIAQQSGDTSNFLNQLATQTNAAFLANFQRGGNFLLCCRVKPRRHFFMSASSLAITSSAGLHSTSPSSISRLRRCTSSSHSASTAGSGGPSNSSHKTRSSVSLSETLSSPISS